MTQNLNEPLSLAEVQVFGFLTSGQSLAINEDQLISESSNDDFSHHVNENKLDEEKNVVVFPNPVLGNLKLSISGPANQDVIIQLIETTSGKVVSEKRTSQSLVEIESYNLKNGLYLARIIYMDGTTIVKNVLKM